MLSVYENTLKVYPDINGLEILKHEIETEEDLIYYLESAIQYNYYTGSYWTHIYNYNNELENIVLNLDLDDEYILYLTHYADAKGDIFIFKKYDPSHYAEPRSPEDDKIKWITKYYDRILTPEEYEELYIIDKYEYVHELYTIPEERTHFIDYEKLFYQTTWDEGIEELNNDYFICFYEVLN